MCKCTCSHVHVHMCTCTYVHIPNCGLIVDQSYSLPYLANLLILINNTCIIYT